MRAETSFGFLAARRRAAATAWNTRMLLMEAMLGHCYDTFRWRWREARQRRELG